jgi:DNA-binding PadR family transcriptional regulator
MTGPFKSHANGKRSPPADFAPPQGIPHGFLRLYILRRIADKPAHGYDLMREIREKTHGAWKPGPGSTYPILKELGARRLIRSTSSKKAGRQQRVYHVTPDGRRFMKEHSRWLASAGRNFAAIRPIIVELTEAEEVPTMFPNMTSSNLGFHRELIESKRTKLSREVLRSLLKEYAQNLESQLTWTNRLLRQA